MSLIQTETPPNPLHKCEAGPIERQLYRQSREAKERLWQPPKTSTAGHGSVIEKVKAPTPTPANELAPVTSCRDLRVLYSGTAKICYTFGIYYKRYEPPPEKISLATIARLVCHGEEITVQQLRGAQRNGQVVLVRHLYCWLCYSLSDKSTSQIGQYLGDRDHSTIIYSVRRIERKLPLEPKLKAKVTRYSQAIRKLYPQFTS